MEDNDNDDDIMAAVSKEIWDASGLTDMMAGFPKEIHATKENEEARKHFVNLVGPLLAEMFGDKPEE